MSEGNPSEATPDLTSEEIATLEELADLKHSDPALYQSIVEEGLAEGARQEYSESLLGMLENATEHRQERDRVLLASLTDAVIRASEAGPLEDNQQ